MFRLQLRPVATLAVCAGVALMGAPAGSAALAAATSVPAPVPAVSDYQLLTSSTTPPTEAACYAIGRRCFTAKAMQNSYNLPPLYALGVEVGQVRGHVGIAERIDDRDRDAAAVVPRLK